MAMISYAVFMRYLSLHHGSFSAGQAFTAPALGHLRLALRQSEQMSWFNAGAPRPAEYSMVVEPHPAGPSIGVYGGLPIAERVIDQFRRPFVYVGVVCRRRDGQFDAASLGPGEFIVEPGLIYRLEPTKHASRDAAKAGQPCLKRAPQLSHEAGERPASAGEPNRVFSEITGALVLFLAGAFIVQLVLHVLGAG